MSAAIMEAIFAYAATMQIGSPALPISWPEVAFDPPDDGKYLEVVHFENRPAFEGVASGRLDQGLLQISVVWQKGQGLLQAAAAADEIIAHFAFGTIMPGVGVRAKVSRQPWQASPIVEADKLKVPVTIPWTAA